MCRRVFFSLTVLPVVAETSPSAGQSFVTIAMWRLAFRLPPFLLRPSRTIWDRFLASLPALSCWAIPHRDAQLLRSGLCGSSLG